MRIHPAALAALAARLELSQRELARGAGLSLGSVNHLLQSGELPRRRSSTLRAQLLEFLHDRGARADELAALQPAAPSQPQPQSKKKAPGAATPEAGIPLTVTTQPEKDDPMLLEKSALTLQARQHFGLPRNPFVDDVQTTDDVYQTPSVRYARAALLDCARHHGFMALVGESGAGKSTLAEDLEERLAAGAGGGGEVVVIRPYVLAMEENDAKGKTLKSGAIAEAVIAALQPHATPRASAQARFAQVHALLREGQRAGRRHLLLIEEAHNLPTATLKHLKRWLELKDGLRRLIGVALIGQTELRRRLSAQNAEVREVAQRCEIVELEPLNNELEGYLRHKFARFDLPYEKVFAPDALDAIRARLIYTPRGGSARDAISICWPLVVNNLVCRAMNAAAAVGSPVVNADVIRGC